MSKVYKSCQVCGKLYEACPFCDSQNDFYAWRSVVCCEEHMAYHIPIISYIRKIITKEQANKDLTLAEKIHGKIEYAPEIRDIVSEIKEDSTIREITSQPKTDNAQVKTKTSSVRKTKK